MAMTMISARNLVSYQRLSLVGGSAGLRRALRPPLTPASAASVTEPIPERLARRRSRRVFFSAARASSWAFCALCDHAHGGSPGRR